MPAKQYQIRLPESAAKILDGQCAKYRWSPPTTLSVSVHTLDRILGLPRAFKYGYDENDEPIILRLIEDGSFEVMEGEEAIELLFFIFQELNKGLVGCFAPEDSGPDGPNTYGEALDFDYPAGVEGSAMMGIDGYNLPLPKLGKGDE